MAGPNGFAARDIASFVGSHLFVRQNESCPGALRPSVCGESALRSNLPTRWAVKRELNFGGSGPFGGSGRGGEGGDGAGDGNGPSGKITDLARAGAVQSAPLRLKRVLMLMSDTGGGHRASSQALKAALEELYPGQLDVKIVDVFADLSGPFFRGIPQQYTFLMKHPTLWRVTYASGTFWPTRTLAQKCYNVFNFGRLKESFAEFDPDMIISVHPLCQGPPLAVLKKLGIRDRVKFVTVVTDLGGANSTWFHSGVDRCYVPTKKLWEEAKRHYMKDSQLRQYGLPTRRMFWREHPGRSQLRRQLGLEQQMPVVLIVGGGDGVGGMREVALACADRIKAEEGPKGAQLVVVCGKNEQLRKKLTDEDWPIPVKVTGFVSNMSEYMAASDCIITKAGPGTIAESLIRGLPIVLSGYLPGQEYGNVKFVVENRVGDYAKGPSRIAEVITDLLSNPDELSAMSRRAKDLGRPYASYDIARNIGELLFGYSRQPNPAIEALSALKLMAASADIVGMRIGSPQRGEDGLSPNRTLRADLPGGEIPRAQRKDGGVKRNQGKCVYRP